MLCSSWELGFILNVNTLAEFCSFPGHSQIILNYFFPSFYQLNGIPVWFDTAAIWSAADGLETSDHAVISGPGATWDGASKVLSRYTEAWKAGLTETKCSLIMVSLSSIKETQADLWTQHSIGLQMFSPRDTHTHTHFQWQHVQTHMHSAHACNITIMNLPSDDQMVCVGLF